MRKKRKRLEIDYYQEQLRRDLECTMLMASSKMIVLQQLDNASENFIKGFWTGYEHRQQEIEGIHEIYRIDEHAGQNAWETEDN